MYKAQRVTTEWIALSMLARETATVERPDANCHQLDIRDLRLRSLRFAVVVSEAWNNAKSGVVSRWQQSEFDKFITEGSEWNFPRKNFLCVCLF